MSSTLTQKKFEARPDDPALRASHTVAVSATSDTKFGIDRVRLNTAYIAALELAGLVPIIVPPLSDASAARNVIAAADGLVLTGGEDVDPIVFNQRFLAVVRNHVTLPPHRTVRR